MNFAKYQSLGNDFIICQEAVNPATIPLLCDRHYGIGADGLVYLTPDFHYFNRDGSLATTCGNALSCALKYLHQQDGTTILHSPPYQARFFTKEKVLVKLGDALPTHPDYPPSGPGLVALPFDQPVYCYHLGNIHAIIESEQLELAPLIATNPLFPNQTNVNFIFVINQSEFKIKTYERGVGWTNGCGTGIAASFFHLYQSGRINQEATAITEGQQVCVRYHQGVELILTPQEVFRGQIS